MGDPKSQQVKGYKSDAQSINRNLEFLKNQAYQARQELITEGSEVTAKAIKAKFKGDDQEKKPLLEVFEEHNNKMESLTGKRKDFSHSTLKKYKTAIKHVKKFLKEEKGNKNYLISKVDTDFLEDFAKQLQKEIEQEEGIKFNVVEPHTFANIPVQKEDGETGMLGVETSEKVWQHLRLHNYINGKGRVQDTLRMDLKHNIVNLPVEVEEQSAQIKALLKKISGKLNIKNADNKRTVKPKKEVLMGPEFRDLWNRIKYKTTYRVDFDTEKLIEACAKELRNKLRVGKARFIYRKGVLETDRGGVHGKTAKETQHTYDATDFQLPDIVSILQNETGLTRKTIAETLIRSERLSAFTNNPQKFIDQALGFIKDKMRVMIVDGIKFHKIGDDSYYAQELFESEELTGYLNENMMKAKKSVHSHVGYDSDVEENFARKFEDNDAVELYAKLPGWFKITTPLGPYNPDWSVLCEIDGEERLYFVVETKGSLFSGDLREKEQGKIDCGREHFKALDSGVVYEPVNNFDTFLDVMDEVK